MVEIGVCIGSSCHIKGSYNVVQTFQQMIEEFELHDKVVLKASFCMKRCHEQGISVTVDGLSYGVEADKARGFFRETILPLTS